MDILPEDNERYSTQEYWDERYEKEGTQLYDWFKGYEELKLVLEKTIPKDKSILMLVAKAHSFPSRTPPNKSKGCGNSELSERMYESGWTNITNVDFSSTVITNMSARCQHMPHMQWKVADVCSLVDEYGFQPESFDFALDKGTIDAFVTGKRDKDPWNPSEETREKVGRYMRQVEKVLKPDGVFIHITFTQPHFRRPLVELGGFTNISIENLGDAFHYFFFTCRK
ncbi:hypothetical protein HK102_005984 [Quaeritorhiza haematococci]|nr:hypothetical protein HK102_005984 [Quaeritorhiza haematococci]